MTSTTPLAAPTGGLVVHTSPVPVLVQLTTDPADLSEPTTQPEGEP